MRLVVVMLATAATLVVQLAAEDVDWCQYWRYLQRDHLRPECNGHFRLRYFRRRAYEQRSSQPSLQSQLPFMPQTRFPTPLPPSLSFGVQRGRVGGLQFDSCGWQHSNCRKSTLCEIGHQLCIDVNGYCCAEHRPTPPTLQPSCPSPAALTSKCAAKSPVSWCETDRDCSPRNNVAFRKLPQPMFASYISAPEVPAMCCPTSCGYNMCV